MTFFKAPENLERLYSEIHLLKTLNHKNIMKFCTSWVDASKRTSILSHKCLLLGLQGSEVKIGDLGVDAILRKSHDVHCVGTPEFMAPEIYAEQYNELVDIYSFGMCTLEMVSLNTHIAWSLVRRFD